MITTTSADLVRNFRKYLDTVESRGEEIVIVRNNQEVARLVPGSAHRTALEAMADLYRTLPEEAAAGWAEDSRDPAMGNIAEELRDPWAT
jgi:prevent-host-death family protein